MSKQPRATRLSNLQYPLLKEFVEMGSSHYMSIDRAQMFDQRPFRSMLHQKWVAYHVGKGFSITRLGKIAWSDFLSRDIFRTGCNLPLTSLFDPRAFGLDPAYYKRHPKTKAKLIEMRRRAS